MTYLTPQTSFKTQLSRSWLKLTSRIIIFLTLLTLALAFLLTWVNTAQGSPINASGQTVYAVTARNRLLKFDSADSCKIISNYEVTGLQKNEKLLAIDFRPANGQLYGLGSTSRLYTINPETGGATLVGTGPFTTSLQGKAFGFDFNPTVDRIRIVSNTGQNLRVHPDTGAIAAVDGTLAFSTTDTYAGRQPAVVAAAYTNPDNDPNTGTTLYDIDAKFDLLVIQNPPNNGTLNTAASLPLNTNRLVGFDISTSGLAYVALIGVEKDEEKEADAWENGKEQREAQGKKCGPSLLVAGDITTGKVAQVGFIGSRVPVRGLAVPTR